LDLLRPAHRRGQTARAVRRLPAGSRLRAAEGLRRPLRPPAHPQGGLRGAVQPHLHRGGEGGPVSGYGSRRRQGRPQPPAAEGPEGEGGVDGQGQDAGVAGRTGAAGGRVGGAASGAGAEPPRAGPAGGGSRARAGGGRFMTWPPRPDGPIDPHVRAFLDDVAENPDDPAPRLVFADWLAERDDPRAELLRLQAECLRGDEEGVEARVQAWLEKHGRDWLGELPPPSGGYSLRLEWGRLEVMGHLADVFLNEPELRGLRHALGEGWFRFFRLTDWDDEQIGEAAGLGLLS